MLAIFVDISITFLRQRCLLMASWIGSWLAVVCVFQWFRFRWCCFFECSMFEEYAFGTLDGNCSARRNYILFATSKTIDWQYGFIYLDLKIIDYKLYRFVYGFVIDNDTSHGKKNFLQIVYHEYRDHFITNTNVNYAIPTSFTATGVTFWSMVIMAFSLKSSESIPRKDTVVNFESSFCYW